MEPFFTAEELALARAYAAPYYGWLAVRDAVVVSVYALLLRFGVGPLFRTAQLAASGLGARLSWVAQVPVARALPAAMQRMWGGPGWGAALLFTLFQLLLLNAVFLPHGVYLSYFHEHRHGLSNHTPWTYAHDALKGLGVVALAQCALAFGLFGLARRLRRWWLWLGLVAGLALLGSGLLDPYRARLYFEQQPLEDGPLRQEISALMGQAKVEYHQVLVEKSSRSSKRLQAYFAGQGPTQTIVLGDLLVQSLEQDEVLAAVAHEAGHLQQSRWPSRLLASLALVAFLYLVHRLLLAAWRRRWLGVAEYADIRVLPLLGLALFALLSAGQPLSAALSRERERAADRYALELTQAPGAFGRMLVKVARANKLDPDPPRWAVLRAHTHPPLKERLARLPQAWADDAGGR